MYCHVCSVGNSSHDKCACVSLMPGSCHPSLCLGKYYALSEWPPLAGVALGLVLLVPTMANFALCLIFPLVRKPRPHGAEEERCRYPLPVSLSAACLFMVMIAVFGATHRITEGKHITLQ